MLLQTAFKSAVFFCHELTRIEKRNATNIFDRLSVFFVTNSCSFVAEKKCGVFFATNGHELKNTTSGGVRIHCLSGMIGRTAQGNSADRFYLQTLPSCGRTCLSNIIENVITTRFFLHPAVQSLHSGIYEVSR